MRSPRGGRNFILAKVSIDSRHCVASSMVSSGSAGERRSPAWLTFLLLRPTQRPSLPNESGLMARSSARSSTASPVVVGSGKCVVVGMGSVGVDVDAASAEASGAAVDACASRRHSSSVAPVPCAPGPMRVCTRRCRAGGGHVLPSPANGSPACPPRAMCGASKASAVEVSRRRASKSRAAATAAGRRRVGGELGVRGARDGDAGLAVLAPAERGPGARERVDAPLARGGTVARDLPVDRRSTLRGATPASSSAQSALSAATRSEVDRLRSAWSSSGVGSSGPGPGPGGGGQRALARSLASSASRSSRDVWMNTPWAAASASAISTRARAHSISSSRVANEGGVGCSTSRTLKVKRNLSGCEMTRSNQSEG